MGATVTNNATIFQFTISNIETPEMTINHLTVAWNNTNGLMLLYNFDAVNPNDSNQVTKLKMYYLGESTGEVVFIAPSTSSNSSSNTNTISAAVFQAFFMLLGFVLVTNVFKRKRN